MEAVNGGGTLHVAVVDDEKEQSENVTRLVKSWAGGRGKKIKLDVFASAESALFELEGGADIMLLDVQMPGMDGVTFARKIRAEGIDAQIIFITGVADFISEGYEVDALHYLLKPVSGEKLFEVLDKAAARVVGKSRSIIFSAGGENVKILASDIFYAEAFSHYVEIHAVSGVLRLKSALSEVEEKLGGGFFRCHRSYIVSLGRVRSVSREGIRLDNGEGVPLSRKLYNAANEAFIRQNWGD